MRCLYAMELLVWERAHYVLQSYSPYTRVVNTLSAASTNVQLQNFNHTPLNHFLWLQNCVSCESQNEQRLSPTQHHMFGPCNRDLVCSLRGKAKLYVITSASSRPTLQNITRAKMQVYTFNTLWPNKIYYKTYQSSTQFLKKMYWLVKDPIFLADRFHQVSYK
jgi:hypothetical protein